MSLVGWVILPCKHILVQLYNWNYIHHCWHCFHHHIQGRISFHPHKIQCKVEMQHQNWIKVYIAHKCSYSYSSGIQRDKASTFSVDYRRRMKLDNLLVYCVQFGFLSIRYWNLYSLVCICIHHISTKSWAYVHIYHIYQSPQLHRKHIASPQHGNHHDISTEFHPIKH